MMTDCFQRIWGLTKLTDFSFDVCQLLVSHAQTLNTMQILLLKKHTLPRATKTNTLVDPVICLKVDKTEQTLLQTVNPEPHQSDIFTISESKDILHVFLFPSA